jgi:hypothetical protein
MKIILFPLFLVFSNSFSQVIKEKDFFRKWKAVVDNDTATCIFLSKTAFIITYKGKTNTFHYNLDSSHHEQRITIRPSKQEIPAVLMGFIRRKSDTEIIVQDFYENELHEWQAENKSNTTVFVEQEDEKVNSIN